MSKSATSKSATQPDLGPIGTRSPSILAGLDPQQRAVVTTIDGQVLVVAGAGTGKTTALTRRVAYLIDRGVPASSILLLTFTRAAAASMIQRARALAPEASGVYGGTFHSVAARLLRDYHEVFGLPATFTVLDPQDCVDVVKSVIADIPYPVEGQNRPRPETVAKILSYEANTRCGLAAAIERRAADYADAFDWFDRVRTAYLEWKVERALVDYDDLLTLFAAMAADPEIGAALRERFSHIMVDEHQDSNPAQIEIIHGLGQSVDGIPGNVLAVGDPAQAIYAFRGSSPRSMFSFVETFPDARILPLERNYRSTQAIIALVNAIDHSMSPRFDRTLRAANDEVGTLPALVRVTDNAQQAREIATRVLAGKEAGDRIADHAILVRSQTAARAVEAELIARRIPYKFVGGIKIDEAAHVKDLLSLARAVENPRNELAWTRVVLLAKGVGPKAAKPIVDRLVACAPAEIVECIEDSPWPKAAQKTLLAAAANALLLPGAPAERLRAALAAFAPLLEARYKEEWPDRQRDIEAVIAVAEGHATLSGFVEAITVDYRVDARERAGNAEQPEEAPLTLSTIHSSKGLEWTHVHIPSFIAGHIPSFMAQNAEEQEEERRVFYVAASRARKTLFLYRPALGDNGQIRQDSFFLDVIRRHLGQVPPLTAANTAMGAGGRPIGTRIDLRNVLGARR